jgi:hypothetical protein
MSLLPASVELFLDFPSPTHLSSSGSYPLDLSGSGDPTGSNATAGLALRVIGTHKPLYHGKVEIPMKGIATKQEILNINTRTKLIEYRNTWTNHVYPFLLT